MSGGTLTTEAEFGRLLYGDAVSTFGRPCSPPSDPEMVV